MAVSGERGVEPQYQPYLQQHPVAQQYGASYPQQPYSQQQPPYPQQYAPYPQQQQPTYADQYGPLPPSAQYPQYNPPTAGFSAPGYQPYAAPTADAEHGGAGGGGHWGSSTGGGGPMDFGIPEDKLITSELDRAIRHAFVRKVYNILFIQLTISFGIALFFNLYQPAGLWLFQHAWLMWVVFIVAFASIIIMTCVPTVARTHPWGFILLMIVSLAMGVVLGFACAAVSTSSFAIAAGITALVALAVSIFACQTKWDFTGCGVFVMVTMLILIVFGIIMIFIRDRIAHIIYAALGALLFSFYMIYDTQQIVGGKHRKFQYSIDDYVFAALTLYLDIINLFLFILTLVTAARGE